MGPEDSLPKRPRPDPAERARMLAQVRRGLQLTPASDTEADGDAGVPESMPAEPPRHGRYVVLEEIGHGGMGRVLRAYDPKLCREVAIKEVRGVDDTEEARQRLVAEARAMAMLSHPNVVAVYDVEELADGRVVLVMEYVRGPTLRAWLAAQRRSWRDVVTRFAAAGRGLAAAHAAGMLHRDFKPANVIVSGGGAKVADFGLAQQEELSPDSSSQAGDGASPRAGTVVGTPRYMAPEQHRGEALTPAVDQYAFCVALWEALCGSPPFDGNRLAQAKSAGPPPWPGGPAPSRIADALRRGLATDPASRWPSMQALLEALLHDPMRTRNRWVLGATSVIVVGLSAFGWHAWSSARAQRCTEAAAAEHLDDAWGDEQRMRVRDAIVGIGASYATAVWERTEQRLDAYATQWKQMHVEACEDTTVRAEQPAEVMDLRMACLHRAEVHLRMATQVLARADAQTVQKAHEVTAGLRPLSRCADIEALRADVEPPLPDEAAGVDAVREHIALVNAAIEAGRYGEARRAADAARAGAGTSTYGPLQAEVALAEGRVLERVGRYADAAEALRDALTHASKWRQRDVMQTAASQLVFVLGSRQRRFEEGLRYADVAQGLVEDEPLGRADVDNIVAIVRREMGQYQEAARLYERALAVFEQTLGPEHPDVASVLNNLAGVRAAEGAYEESATLYERALAIREQALGPEHPDVATSLANLANVRYATGAYEEAVMLNARAMAIREQALGPEHPDVAASLNNLAVSRQATGAYEEAATLHARALAIKQKQLGDEHPDVATSLDNLAIVRAATGAYDEAATLHTRALAIREQVLGPEHPDVATSLHNVAEVRYQTGAHDEAAMLHARALSIWEKALGPEHPLVAPALVGLARVARAQNRAADAVRFAERAVKVREAGAVSPAELAQARFELARALMADDDSRSRAIDVAEQARDAYEEAGEAHDNARAEIEAFLRDHRRTPAG